MTTKTKQTKTERSEKMRYYMEYTNKGLYVYKIIDGNKYSFQAIGEDGVRFSISRKDFIFYRKLNIIRKAW